MRPGSWWRGVLRGKSRKREPRRSVRAGAGFRPSCQSGRDRGRTRRKAEEGTAGTRKGKPKRPSLGASRPSHRVLPQGRRGGVTPRDDRCDVRLSLAGDVFSKGDAAQARGAAGVLASVAGRRAAARGSVPVRRMCCRSRRVVVGPAAARLLKRRHRRPRESAACRMRVNGGPTLAAHAGRKPHGCTGAKGRTTSRHRAILIT